MWICRGSKEMHAVECRYRDLLMTTAKRPPAEVNGARELWIVVGMRHFMGKQCRRDISKANSLVIRLPITNELSHHDPCFQLSRYAHAACERQRTSQPRESSEVVQSAEAVTSCTTEALPAAPAFLAPQCALLLIHYTYYLCL